MKKHLTYIDRPERGVADGEEAELVLEADARSNRCSHACT
jgi:hypothetical protein